MEKNTEGCVCIYVPFNTNTMFQVGNRGAACIWKKQSLHVMTILNLYNGFVEYPHNPKHRSTLIIHNSSLRFLYC